MKRTFTSILGMILIVSIQAQDQSKCAHCSMLIRDELHMAVAVENTATIKFDAIECLINFLKDHDETNYSELLVADYSENGQLVDARTATFLKSSAIPSPMGAYLSAFGSVKVAEIVKNDKGGDLFTWEEIKQKFKDSRFGLLDHPDHHHDRPDAYAPIGIMGDHVHHKGGFMISLRAMHMNMDGNLKRTSSVNDMEVHEQYMVAPQTMQMTMYMLGAMYAPSDKLTVMLMQPLVKKEMNLSSMMGMDFSTLSSGLGDTKISFLYSLVGNENSSLHLNSSISIPQGKITNRDDTPMAQDMKLPYPMQLGSGTVDMTIGGTYKTSLENVSFGVQQLSTFRTGENSEGYRFGNLYELSSWGSYKVTNWVSFSARLQGSMVAKLYGSDDELNPMMVTTADPRNTGSKCIRSFVGTNISFNNKALENLKLGVELGMPIYQYVRGIQMNEQGTLNAGIRYLL